MRVVVTGATGNVGTSVLEALAQAHQVDEVIGVARRLPQRKFEKVRFVSADITSSDLVPLFEGAAVVIHLAWLIQPGRSERITHAVNVEGSRRVFNAVTAADVPALVYASSVGAYSRGPQDRLVDEQWPTAGTPSSFYSRHKVAVERLLDVLEHDRPTLRIVRMRPALIFKAEAAAEIRRLFAGPWLPRVVLRRHLLPIVPDVRSLRFQVVHSQDVGDAYARATVDADAHGAFNLTADSSLTIADLAQALSARPVAVSPRLLRNAADAAFRLRLSPTEPGWLDMAMEVPLLDSTRAREELGWRPHLDAIHTLTELLDGIGNGTDLDTPPLAASTSGPARLRADDRARQATLNGPAARSDHRQHYPIGNRRAGAGLEWLPNEH